MKNWKAAEWCLFILTCTIPICMVGMIMIRLVTGSTISVEAGTIIMDMLKVVGGGVLGICGTLLNQNNKDKL